MKYLLSKIGVIGIEGVTNDTIPPIMEQMESRTLNFKPCTKYSNLQIAWASVKNTDTILMVRISTAFYNKISAFIGSDSKESIEVSFLDPCIKGKTATDKDYHELHLLGKGETGQLTPIYVSRNTDQHDVYEDRYIEYEDRCMDFEDIHHDYDHYEY